ncbi:MAG TPA: cellulase family glycosylhydrolase [Bacillota bacterium]|nr:cellulase family glycosylhydrolase [Bacillota bacterium]
MGKYSKEWSSDGFSEEDFQLISQLGFNFVRLPLDYRFWIINNNWESIDEKALQNIDQAVDWGGKYGIHVCLNFHRAPGFCVNPPAEPGDLWTDPKVQTVCAKHWAFFAKRYRRIPNRRLSFNLLNEPTDLEPQTYFRVVEILTQAIRQEDPERLIIADGLAFGNKPLPELVSLKVAQSTRGYRPFYLSHYKAEWVQGAGEWELPEWPAPGISNYLYGNMKPEFASSLVIEGENQQSRPFSEGCLLRLRVNIVSIMAEIVIKADGKTILSHKITCGPEPVEGEQVVYNSQQQIYQNIYNKDYVVRIPNETRRVEIGLGEGDWLTFAEIGLSPADGGSGEELVIKSHGGEWGSKPGTIYLDAQGNLDFDRMRGEPGARGSYSREWLWEECIEPWRKLESQGSGVMVGEWGAYRRTPHEVTLRWMQDCLENWKKAGWGWALWNFRGDFGILDSRRSDVQYENFHGHLLDRAMLELLRKY